MPLTRSVVTTLFLLLLAGPAWAQNDDWAVSAYRPAGGWLDFPRGSKASIDAEPCCAPTNGGTQPSPTEAPTLKQLAGHVSRDGEVLRLGLDGGRTLKITDCPDFQYCNAQTRVHRLVGWWPAQRYYLVEVRYEGGPPGVYLISERDGSATVVLDRPVLSPSGRYAIAFMSSPVVAVLTTIIDLATDPPKVVDVARPNCAGFDDQTFLRPKPVWIDDTTLRFEGDLWPGVHIYTGKVLLRVGVGRPRWEC